MKPEVISMKIMLICPFCGLKHDDEDGWLLHIQRAHVEITMESLKMALVTNEIAIMADICISSAGPSSSDFLPENCLLKSPSAL
jgi:hypothetical protein